ncbi:hypothetical protein CAG99_26725 [Streptomyces marincola]|uniref:Uncharacterized protein n=1 Tax=Streptomyces marincola TaxID=2878388 RepID=A0A1W7D4L6_9ACTN|nr:hypothetical protein CAG99_26725 [Streptomyces marincola]
MAAVVRGAIAESGPAPCRAHRRVARTGGPRPWDEEFIVDLLVGEFHGGRRACGPETGWFDDPVGTRGENEELRAALFTGGQVGGQSRRRAQQWTNVSESAHDCLNVVTIGDIL